MQDVRYVVARDIPSGKTLMFRNEDIPWPPYLKFDSGDLSGQVMNLEENNPEATILATYYGFRVPFLSLYPNITNIRRVDKDYEHKPIFNSIVVVIFVLLGLLGFFWIFRKFRSQKAS